MNAISGQCAVLQLFKFQGAFGKTWSMFKMISSRLQPPCFQGLQFFKPLGIGSGNGYQAWPDFEASGFFMVFDSFESSMNFRKSNQFAGFLKNSSENYCVMMRPISSRGSWSGFNSWEIDENQKEYQGPICSLTRATLKPEFLYRFWKMVSPISSGQKDHKGLLFSQGVGEIPLVEQATFTIWDTKKDLEEFGRSNFHGKAVNEVNRLGGFKEQMFTRFEPLFSEGTWKGKNPLSAYS